MNVLIVLGHPSIHSLNAGLSATAAAALSKCGHDVRVADLYQLNFDARIRTADFPPVDDAGAIDIVREQAMAYKEQRLHPDIVAQIDLVRWSDLVILQFPIWWFGPPAIIKGWMDRVLVPGFSYGRGHWFEAGRLAGRKALVSTTVNAVETSYAPDGRFGAMDVTLWPVHLTLRYVGFEVLEPFVAYRVNDAEWRERAMETLSQRLRSIETERGSPYPSLEDFGADSRLLPEVEPLTFVHGMRPLATANTKADTD